jgi:hypothetical protein
MGDIHRVQGVSAASLGGLPEAKVGRQEGSKRQGQQPPAEGEQGHDDLVELHDVAVDPAEAQTSDTTVVLDAVPLDLTA